MSRALVASVLGGCSMVVNYDDDGGADDTSVTDSGLPTSETGTPDTGWSIVGEATGDGIGSGGLWIAPDLNEDGHPELVVGAPEIDAIGVFESTAIGPATPFGDAYVRVVGSDEGVGRSAAILADDAGPFLAVGAPEEGAVWILSMIGLSGVVDPEDVAVGVVEGGSSGVTGDDDDDDGELSESLASGDYDGDGRVDLALGAPGRRGGDGEAYLVDGDEGYGSGTVDVDDVRVRIRGVGGRLGATVAMGALDDGGLDGLLACAPDQGAGGVCHYVAGPLGVDDRDVIEVEAATVSGTAVDALGGVPPRVDDVDLDGRADLLLITDGGVLYVFLGGLSNGAHTLDEAGLIVTGGPVTTAVGDGSLLVGAPQAGGVGAIYALEAAAGTRALPSEGTLLWEGVDPGGAFGTVTSDVGALIGPTDIAVGSPTNAGRVTIFARDGS